MTSTGPTNSSVVDPLVIVGPTASGKSAVAMGIAESLMAQGHCVELLSADSMQVYRGMDVGTAKPSPEDQHKVPHHLIDLVAPSEEFSVAEFLNRSRATLEEASGRGSLSIVVGGTGLYVQALVDGMDIPGQFPEVRAGLDANSDTGSLYRQIAELDPRAAERIEPGNRRRIIRALEVTIGSGRAFSSYGPGLDAFPVTSFTMVGIEVDRAVLTERIRHRLMEQVRDGFVAEVEQLSRGAEPSRTASQALGYKELVAHLRGEMTLEAAIETAAKRTRQFAVRQIKWFRRDPRIRWFSYDVDPTELVGPIEKHWIHWPERAIIG